MNPPKFIVSLLPIACAGFLWQFTPAVQAEEIKGVEVPEELVIGEETLVLNGTAVRSVWGFGVYVVGLYLNESTGDEKSIMKGNEGHKRVHMTMLREVKSEKFLATVQENIDSNFTNAEKQKFAAELKSFLGCFGDGLVLEKKHEVNVDFLPGQGTLVSIEGKEIKTIPGDDFYHAILRLWIGEPLQASLKPGLLGLVD